MSASEKQPRQNVARVRYPACGNGLVFKELATWGDLMANYKSPKFIFGKIYPSVRARPDVLSPLGNRLACFLKRLLAKVKRTTPTARERD